MKDESVVERKFIASLHQAVEDIAPEELEVFEKWFTPADRRPRYHIAPVIGVLGYLRKNPSQYIDLMNRAGRLASQWCYREFPKIQKKFARSRFVPGRERLMRRLLRMGLRKIHRDGELETRRDEDKLVITLKNSLFCRTTTPTGNGPACKYYAALFAGLVGCIENGHGEMIESHCRAQGAPSCEFESSRGIESEQAEVRISGESPVV
jgi:predicted hydrocarbon binding protein